MKCWSKCSLGLMPSQILALNLQMSSGPETLHNKVLPCISKCRNELKWNAILLSVLLHINVNKIYFPIPIIKLNLHYIIYNILHLSSQKLPQCCTWALNTSTKTSIIHIVDTFCLLQHYIWLLLLEKKKNGHLDSCDSSLASWLSPSESSQNSNKKIWTYLKAMRRDVLSAESCV